MKSQLAVVLCSIPLQTVKSRSGDQLPVTPKMAIVSLMVWMNKFGYSADFYDVDMFLPSETEMFNYFKSKQPNVVGLSAVVSTSYLKVKIISKIIREASPSALIVLGGNMAASANVLLRKTEVDICVLGDGEKPWVSILDWISNNEPLSALSNIKGVAFLNERDELEFTGYGEPIPNDEISFPDYDVLSKGFPSQPSLIENYFREGKKCDWFKHDSRTYESSRKHRLAVLWTTKGCVARCTFCQRFCVGYRMLSLDKLDKHLSELKMKYDVGFIEVADENFGSNKKHSYEVAKLMKKHDMLWFAGGVRCSSFSREDFQFFNDHGCTGMKFGIETGSQKIFDVMDKRVTVNTVFDALKNAHEANLYAPLSLCIGMPGETDETVMETGRFVGQYASMLGVSPSKIEIGIFWALPLPGAPLYEYGILRGVIGKNVDAEESYLVSISDKSANKDNFVNLTGEHVKNVLFWDFLVRYEAMRTFALSLVGKKKSGKGSGEHTVRKLGVALHYPMLALNSVVSKSFLAAKFPKRILYPLMRNLLYAEHVFHGRKTENTQICGHIMRAESLRLINGQLRQSFPCSTSLTEKNQAYLRLGR